MSLCALTITGTDQSQPGTELNRQEWPEVTIS